ncbi:conserved hypothetical protein [Candidatus Terasakiella magnetica]|nr:conserved hypothetical protein [Candidatus Terasakiella magnetica]
MPTLTGAPSHILLNRKDQPASHSTRPEKTGPASAFSSYAFGPMDMPDSKNGADVSGTKAKAISGASSLSSVHNGIGWMTQLAASQHIK